MRKFIFSTGFMALALVGASAHATVINFDSLDASGGPASVTTQYSGLGVTFSGLYVMESAPPYVSTLPNVGVINDETPFSLLITATFSANVSDVSAIFYDSNVGTNLVTMKAYDASNILLGMISATTPAAEMDTVSLSFTGIRKVTLETDLDGSLFDDFTFTPSITSPNAVPEPASLGLLGLGLAGLGFASRRKAA